MIQPEPNWTKSNLPHSSKSNLYSYLHIIFFGPTAPCFQLININITFFIYKSYPDSNHYHWISHHYDKPVFSTIDVTPCVRLMCEYNPKRCYRWKQLKRVKKRRGKKNQPGKGREKKDCTEGDCLALLNSLSA